MARQISYCTEPGCTDRVKARSLCQIHYQRLMRSGTVEAKPPRSDTGLQFIKAAIKVETDECILWPYGKDSDGYGKLMVDTAHHRAHSLSLRLAKGSPPTPDKTLALHTCRNKSCFNPKHLYWGDHADNTRDKVRDGTQAKGEANGWAKITEEQVLEIRKLAAEGVPWNVIGKRFGLTQSHAICIGTGENWAHLPDAVSKRGKRKGEKHSSAKLTEEQVREIHKRVSEGETQSSVAHALNLSRGAVHLIVHRKNWAHVE